MTENFEKIEELLKKNDWKKVKDTDPEEPTSFTKKYYENVIRIEIVLNKEQISEENPYYGISEVMLQEYEWPMPYRKEDMKDMLLLLQRAEHDLLCVGIPFRPNYIFGKISEEILEKNLILRKKYGLCNI